VTAERGEGRQTWRRRGSEVARTSDLAGTELGHVPAESERDRYVVAYDTWDMAAARLAGDQAARTSLPVAGLPPRNADARAYTPSRPQRFLA
jgi:hypothetical protein